MNCSDFRDRLDEMLDGLLPPEEEGRRQAHAEQCTDCAAEAAEAERFRALLDGAGAAALDRWHARRLAARAAAAANGGSAAVPRPARALLATRPWWQRSGLRYAAAAAVLAAALVVGVGSIGSNTTPVLAAGPHTLLSGEVALTGPGREVRAERTLRLRVEPGTEGASLAVDGGAATFRIDGDRHCNVATPRGLAQARGASFLLEVRQDDSVAVTVLIGEVQFDGDHDSTSLVAGDRLEVDETGSAQVVNRDRVVALELAADVGAAEAAHLRRRAYALERELTELREHVAATPAEGTAETAPGELPWAELGGAARDLLVRRGPASKERRMRAMGVLLVHSEAILGVTGAKDPREALTNPAFLTGVAPHFVAALAPTASDDARETTTTAILDAAERLRFALESDPLPTERLAALQQLGVTILRTIQDELGDGRAAEVASAMPRGWGWDVIGVQPFTLSEHTVAKFVSFWTKRYDLSESQQDALRPFVERYVEETLAEQDGITARLGEERVRAVLFPESGWRERWSASQNGERLTETDAEIVANQLTRMEARLQLAPPRIALEQALKGLLREDQLGKRDLVTGWGLPVFRPAPEE